MGTDPLRSNRRIGGQSSSIVDTDDETDDTEDDNDLVRLHPGQVLQVTYTFSVVPKAKGLRHSDVWNLTIGNTYNLTLRNQRWWWAYEDDMDDDISEKQRRSSLKTKPLTEWGTDCSANFTFVE
jgi:hypothetical protein